MLLLGGSEIAADSRIRRAGRSVAARHTQAASVHGSTDDATPQAANNKKTPESIRFRAFMNNAP